MNKEEITERVNLLRNQAEMSANNHNALLGRLAESMYFLQMIESQEDKKEEVQDDGNNASS